MTITVLQEGSLAKSSTLNNNFQDLQNQIATVSATTTLISQNLSSLASNVSSISDTVASNALNAFQLSQDNTISGSNTFSGAVTFTGNITRNWGTTTISAATPAVIIETYQNTLSGSGYNLYSNGFCEQWGTQIWATNSATYNVSLLKTYKDTNYFVLTSSNQNYNGLNTKGGTSQGLIVDTETIAVSTGGPTNEGVGNPAVGYSITWFTFGYTA